MNVCVECRADEIFIRRLIGYRIRDVIHSGNKPRVVNDLMQHYTGSIGLVDEDPGSVAPPRMRWFNQMNDYSYESYRVLYEPRRTNHLFVLNPRLEGWVLRACRLAEIDVTRYGLPTRESHFHSLINIRTERFGRLLDDLMGTRLLNHIRDRMLNSRNLT